jgi:WD40 repeat protein
VAVSPDGRLVAAGGSAESAVKVFEVATGREVRSIQAPPGATYTLGYSGDGKSIVASHADGTLRAWDAETGQESRNLSAAGYVHAYAFSRDGKLMAYPTADGSIQVVESAGWRETVLLEGHPGGTCYLAFDPTGRFLATTGQDASVKVWDISTRKMVNALATGVGQMSRIAFSADGQSLIVTGTEPQPGVIRVFGRKK